jgi:hypothetical protein
MERKTNSQGRKMNREKWTKSKVDKERNREAYMQSNKQIVILTGTREKMRRESLWFQPCIQIEWIVVRVIVPMWES